MRMRLPARPSPEGADRERLTSNLVGLTIAGVWLVFLLEPIAAAWARRDDARGDIGLVATLAFAAVYLLHFQRSRGWAFRGPEETPRPQAWPARWGRYAALVALAALATVTIGQPGTTTWVFVAVAGLWTMPVWAAVGAGVGLIPAYETLVRVVPDWSRSTGVSLSIAMAMIAVGAGMLASRRARDLSEVRRENARLAVEEERNRLARDIHDILGHSLTVITVKAELAGRLLDVDLERARAEITSLEGLAREALADVRGAVVGVREISLTGELARARRALTSAGIEATLPTAVDAVAPSLKELFAWTVRESVTNVIRHSAASRCEVVLAPERITVRDNGRGLVAGMAGNGLRGLRERARLAGAVVTTSAGEGHGFEISVGLD